MRRSIHVAPRAGKLRIANADVLPFDRSATCDEFVATIAAH
jgi:hypothetical protein